MTHSHDNHAPPSGADVATRGSPPGVDGGDAARIAAELAALGEGPAEDEELSFATAGGRPEADEDVVTVGTLVGLSAFTTPAGGLLPLERHRVWRRIGQRLAAAEPVADPHEPAANAATGWRGLVASLALVAGVVLVPRLDAPSTTPEQRATARAEAQTMSEAARLALEGLPGEQDGSRARSLADDYAARLRATRGGGQ